MSESEGAKSDAALGCPACGSQNPPDHRFCGACGATLDQTLASGIRREIERQIGVRLKDAQIVEFEVSEKILTRLVKLEPSSALAAWKVRNASAASRALSLRKLRSLR